MSSRRFLALVLLAPVFVSGCGAVQGVRTAFEMPVAPTPSPRDRARLRETRSFDSLSGALSKLNADTVRQIWGTTPSMTPTGARYLLQPAPFGARPASSLLGDLRGGVNVPLSPGQIPLFLQPAREVGSVLPPSPTSATTTFVPTRRLYSSRLSGVEGGISDSAEAFLRAWAARESLRRADEELLGRRILEDRISLQARSTLPALDLSLVPPETQLELSNLRLKLLPLLQIPRTQRLQAAGEIEAIEARLNQIWERETARQAALLNQTLVEIPARLRREGESVLAQQRRDSAAQSAARLAEVRRDLATRSQLPSAAGLSIVQERAPAPNSGAIRAQLNAPLGGSDSDVTLSTRIGEGRTDIARRGAGPPGRVPAAIVAKNERIWREATR